MDATLDIKRAIQEHALTSAEVANRMGVSPQSLVSFIKGNPTVSSLYLIAKAIGCDVRDLFFSPSDIPTSLSPAPSTYACPRCGTKFRIINE